jgi:hypothetical protein
MKKNILIILFATLAGCNSVAPPAGLAGKLADDFFVPSKGKLATAYFTCGKFLQHYIIDQEMDLEHCDFVINSESYTTLQKNTIGRLELPPGRYQIKQVDDDGSIPNKTVEIDLAAGETVLFKTAFTQTISVGGTIVLGAIGGQAFGSRLASIEVFKNPSLANQKSKIPVAFQKKSD